MASVLSARDRKKESFWRRHIRAQKEGGLSVAAYCRRHGLREYGFYWWRRELARRDAALPAAFVPVQVTAEPPAEKPGALEIVLPGDRRVRVMGAVVDRRMLRDVLWAMEEGRLERAEDRRC